MSKIIVSTLSNCVWETPLRFPTLANQEAHVWCANLDYSTADLAHFFALLSSKEKDRAQRFHFAVHRNRFTAARGLLRTLLGRYLQLPPQAIEFAYNEHGKPKLVTHPTLQFNLSHSQNVALFAFAYNFDLGIDIEFKKESRDLDGIAQRFFSTNESALLHSLTGAAKTQAFFNGWTRKEAFLKALGLGLSYPLKQVEVSMAATQPAQFIALHDKDLQLTDWFIYELKPLANYAAALVVKGKLLNLKTWCCSDNFI